MRILIWLILILPAATSSQEEKEKWQRIYTGEDSVIEINVSKVTFGDRNIGRVRFRTVLSKSQAVKNMPAEKYKSRLETIEFKCTEKRYRIYETSLIDSQGKAIQSDEGDLSEEWKVLKRGGMMERLFGPACRLIDEKRLNPGR